MNEPPDSVLPRSDTESTDSGVTPRTLPTPQEIDVVVEEFEDYDLPELREFMRQKKQKIGGLRPDLINRLRDVLTRGVVNLDAAYAYIDELREHGRQHLFLFHVQQAHRDDLSKLRGKLKSLPISLTEKPQEPTLTAIIE